MSLFKIVTLIFSFTFFAYGCHGQNEKDIENSDESKILKVVKTFNYFDQNAKTLKIPKRKYDSPFFCDEMLEYKNGYIINSITSSRGGGKIDFTTNFFYYNPIDKSIKKVIVSKADTIESIVSSRDVLYYSIIQNGKRDIGYFKENQYQSLINKCSNDIRKYLDTTKWVKLGIQNDNLFVLSPNYLFEFSANDCKSLVNYSLDDLYLNKLKYRRSISMLPTKNIVIKNNSVYFLQEIVQERTCNLLILNITNGNVENFFTSLDYKDNYLKQVNDFTHLNDNSLLVLVSRLIGNQMVINTKENKTSVWVFNNNLTTSNGAMNEIPATTALNSGDTLILAASKGLYFKLADTIETLAYFDNYHQTIKDKDGDIDFEFEPRSIKKLSNHIYLVGGMWGGLYQIDVLNHKLTCLDDVDYDKIKTVDLSDL